MWQHRMTILSDRLSVIVSPMIKVIDQRIQLTRSWEEYRKIYTNADKSNWKNNKCYKVNLKVIANQDLVCWWVNRVRRWISDDIVVRSWCICYTGEKKVRESHCQRPRGKGVKGSLSSSRRDRSGGREESINLRDDVGDCGCMRRDSCALPDDCAELSPYMSGEGPVTVVGAIVIDAETDDGSSRNVSLGLREVGEIRCADARPAWASARGSFLTGAVGAPDKMGMWWMQERGANSLPQ